MGLSGKKWSCLVLYLGWTGLLLFFVFDQGYSVLDSQNCLYISEVMYNPEGSDTKYEYLEVCNACNISFEMDKVYLGGVDFTFSSYIIEPYSAVVVLRSNDNNELNTSDQLCCFSGSLVNSGKNISLWNKTNESLSSGILLDSFDYPVKSDEGYAAVRYINGSVEHIFKGDPGICDIMEQDIEYNNDSSEVNVSNTTSTNSTINNTINNTPNNITNNTPNSTEGSEGLNSSINQTANQITNQTDNQTNDGINQTVNESINQSTNSTNSSSNNSTFINETSELNQNNTEINQSQSNSELNNSNSTLINDSQLNDINETNQSLENQTDDGGQEESVCKQDFLYIKAPELIGEDSVGYEIRLFKWNCSSYLLKDFEYVYWVEDFCDNVLRDERVSSYFGDKSFTPRTDCCAYAIKAKLIEPFESELVTKYLIKPEACLKGSEAIENLSELDTEEVEEEHESGLECPENPYLIPLNDSDGIIESFYTRKKYFESDINFYANLDLEDIEGEPMLFIAEKVIEAEDGKNTFALNLSNDKGYLFLSIANQSHLLDAYLLNYSFELDEEGKEGEAEAKVKETELPKQEGKVNSNTLLSDATQPASLNKFLEMYNISSENKDTKKPAIQGASVYLSSDSSEQKGIYRFIIPILLVLMAGIFFYYRKYTKTTNTEEGEATKD